MGAIPAAAVSRDASGRRHTQGCGGSPVAEGTGLAGTTPGSGQVRTPFHAGAWVRRQQVECAVPLQQLAAAPVAEKAKAAGIAQEAQNRTRRGKTTVLASRARSIETLPGYAAGRRSFKSGFRA